MGVWHTKLFSNDTSADVKDTYIQFLEQQKNCQEAYQKTLKEFSDILGTDEEPLLWYALADIQWDLGRLLPEVKEKALRMIDRKAGNDFWDDNPKYKAKWERALQLLKEKLLKEPPPEKKIETPDVFTRNPWNNGDVYAYCFHTPKSQKNGLFGKYILFQKMGDVEYYKDVTFSVIQIFNQVFEAVPAIDVVNDLCVLPLVDPPGVDGMPDSNEQYVPSFEWFLKATMIFDKKTHYPKKYFTFVGNKDVPFLRCSANEHSSLFWEKDKMEDWLVDYYLNWRKHNP